MLFRSSMPVTSEVFRLLTNIQDEVHRFAITYHKQKRRKSLIHSELDEIKGVGPVAKQKILSHFGSVKRARMASMEEMVNLLGKSLGSMVYEQLQAKITR